MRRDPSVSRCAGDLTLRSITTTNTATANPQIAKKALRTSTQVTAEPYLCRQDAVTDRNVRAPSTET